MGMRLCARPARLLGFWPRSTSARGQVTVEMVVAIPVVLIVAVISINALLFFGECAAFDRQARDSIRAHATSLAYGYSSADAAAQIEADLNSSFSQDFEHVLVSVQGASAGHVRYEATIEFTPTLVGRAFSGTVFGTALPRLRHTTGLTIDPYKPGAIV